MKTKYKQLKLRTYDITFDRTPPPQLPQLTAPPTQPQLPAPQPFTFSLDNKFGNMLENILMPRNTDLKLIHILFLLIY
jgi:hypothetical protein